MMKKNRSYGRYLKKQVRELESENTSLHKALEIRNYSYAQVSRRLSSIENRIQRLAGQYIVSDKELQELSLAGRLVEDTVRESLVRDILHSENLHKFINVEVDHSFCGLGTRYEVELRILNPS